MHFSRNAYDWLGHGIYFWENNQQRALDFAKEVCRSRSGRIKIPASIGAILDLGFCLDLLEAEGIRLVADAYDTFLEPFKTLDVPLPQNISPPGSTEILLRNLDCAVIECLHLERSNSGKRPFDSVRNAFIEGEPLYPSAGFYSKSHIQLCIRNPNCIKGYFLPRTANDQWLIP